MFDYFLAPPKGFGGASNARIRALHVMAALLFIKSTRAVIHRLRASARFARSVSGTLTPQRHNADGGGTERRAVELGLTTLDSVEVVKGLSPGDKVVLVR